MKKAISPLIATVLLISLSIVLATITYTIYKSSTEDIIASVSVKSQVLCNSQTELKIDNLQTNNQISFEAENIGSSDINGLIIRIYPSSDVITIQTQIKAANKIKIQEPYNLEIEEIKIIPLNNENSPCINKLLSFKTHN